MTNDVNKIHNASFSRGKNLPARWAWNASSKRNRWFRDTGQGTKGDGGVTVETVGHDGEAFWEQLVVCKPGEFYRVEATVTCDLTASGNDPRGQDCGFVLAAQPMMDGKPVGDGVTTPGYLRSTAALAVRTVFEVPEGIRRVRLRVGVVRAAGTVEIGHVRFIPILELDEESHFLAIPAPPHTLPAPRVARKVCLCSSTASQRPLSERLGGYFGEASVRCITPQSLATRKPKCDALLMPDPSAPRCVRSIAGLIKLATDKIVVISLPAFSQLAGDALSLKRVEQDDDPIHAKVTYANHATRGFALQDVFPYAWPGRTPCSFVQNQFRNTGAMKVFCKKHGFVTLLASMCDKDVTSDRPICFYKETPGGGLFALDIEPVEQACSTLGETNLAIHVLLSVLGQSLSGLGRYASSVGTQTELCRMLRDIAARQEPFVVHDADLPDEETTDQLVTIGREDESFGLPMQQKPVILVRSGLTPGDAESLYGAMVWFKQFIRMVPHECPYALALSSQFRLAWVPSVATWSAGTGWSREDDSSKRRMGVEMDGGDVAALIDIVSHPVNRTRVVLPSGEGEYRRYARWLPELATAFPAGRHYVYDAPENGGYQDRDLFGWGLGPRAIEVVVEPDKFEDDAAQDVLAAGGEAIRIEVPGSGADTAALSIQRTDLTATMLEHVIGLQLGLVALNRQSTTVTLSSFPPVGPDKMLVIDRRDPMLRSNASQAV